MYGKSFYTLNVKRIESIKRLGDASGGSFEDSIKAEDIAITGVSKENSIASASAPNSPREDGCERRYEHLSSTVVAYASSGELEKDPNMVVRSMKRNLKPVSF